MNNRILIIIYTILIISNVYSQVSPVPEFSDRLFSITGISYNNYDFSLANNYGLPSDCQPITILGWSRDGNIFYQTFMSFYGSRTYYIKNLVTDEIIWRGDYRDFERTNFSQAFISEIVNRFNIEPNAGIIGEFPYRWNNYTYECFGANERRESPNLDRLLIDILIRRNQSSQKKLNSVYAYRSWALNNITDNLRFRYVRSPFENRIAVIVLIPQIHSEFDYPYYEIEVLGCHLNTGFN
ncbi:MAG: hypothetical protein LBI28_02175 [Treponema sp.]|jgi:hypothetical protein|nr:hypothetical protein [Treponema sp.]